MTEFWEKNFKEKQEMWGLQPANSAVITSKLFAENKYKTILIPGVGYGRNAQAFIAQGMDVTGIEISKTAIELAEKEFGQSIKIYHGSVKDMPFDDEFYDGVFSHALIHLLDKNDRINMISACYNQLRDGGQMVFTTISKKAVTYGQGTLISKDRYEQFGGVQTYFYDDISINDEFGSYGLYDVSEVIENYPFYLIKCCKNANNTQDLTLN